MALRTTSAAVVLAATAITATPARAQDAGGFHLKVIGGASLLRGTDLTGAISGAADFGAGPVLGGALGYDYADSPFRSELEFAYRSGDADPFAGGATGDFASTSLMINGYYDFASTGRITPYVGAGLGYVTEIDFDIAGGTAGGEYSGRGGVAWQVMAGAAYGLSDRLSLLGEVRYFDAGSRTLSGTAGNFTADYATMEAIVGLRFRF
jgi:opacity protein-like surface antigen